MPDYRPNCSARGSSQEMSQLQAYREVVKFVVRAREVDDGGANHLGVGIILPHHVCAPQCGDSQADLLNLQEMK